MPPLKSPPERREKAQRVPQRLDHGVKPHAHIDVNDDNFVISDRMKCVVMTARVEDVRTAACIPGYLVKLVSHYEDHAASNGPLKLVRSVLCTQLPWLRTDRSWNCVRRRFEL
ncbi:hypothetical protein A0H81_03370 [Grifola frondosa]|uniref:Uncharacterized protein n=1 Tax=Grifola frondosa TaxID=5627 RepID=A0A1C7MMF1_GRIFR|nr:hypothetical protein A0H81_03370 [Grifola frondosa]